MTSAAELARAARGDCGSNSAAFTALSALGSCGTDGRHGSNAERDFLRWTKGIGGLLLEPYPINLTLQVSRLETSKPSFCEVNYLERPTEVIAYVLLPHEVLHAIYAADMDQA